MALTPDQREDVIAHLKDRAEAKGVDIVNPQELLELALDELTIDPVPNADRRLRRELRQLRAQRPQIRDKLDAVIARIAEIEALLP